MYCYDFFWASIQYHLPDFPFISLALRLRALRAISVSVELVGW